MHSREDAFRAKFASAGTHLNAPPEQLISLKFRERVVDHSEYRDLVRTLEHEAGVHSTSVEGSFQGNAYLISNSKTKVIVVEHETGLEILYIAGSIASLVGLVPLILRCWNALDEWRGRRRPPRSCEIEIRRVDEKGNLSEDHSTAMDVHWAAPLSVMNSALLSAAEIIDAEIQGVRQSVEDLAERVTAIEVKKTRTKRKSVTKKRKN